MARYFLNLDPRNPAPGSMEKIEEILKREYGDVKDGVQLFSFLFHTDVREVWVVAKNLEYLLRNKFDVVFTVINLDEETIAYGESYLSYFNRMAERAWKAMVGKRTVKSKV